MKIGTNTYGLGTSFTKDYEGTLHRLQEGGITAIEPCVDFKQKGGMSLPIRLAMKKMGLLGGVFDKREAPEKIAGIREMGFDVYSIHLFNTVLKKDSMVEVADFMEANRIRCCVYSPQESSVTKIQAQKKDLEECFAYLAGRGLALLVHNHDNEFTKDGDSCVMEYLFENVKGMQAELDLGWAQYAGADVISCMKKYESQICILHIKEVKAGAKAHTREPFCTAPGEGILPLEEILKTSRAMPLDAETCYIIDQDDSVNGDIVADIVKGVKNIGILFD